MHVDNWRHLYTPYEVPCQFAVDHGMKLPGKIEQSVEWLGKQIG